MCVGTERTVVTTLHRRPWIGGVAAALAVGAVAQYWFGDAWLTGTLGLCYFATGYYSVRFGHVNTSLRGLDRRAKAIGFLGLVATGTAVATVGERLAATDHEVYLYVALVLGFGLFFVSLAGANAAERE